MTSSSQRPRERRRPLLRYGVACVAVPAMIALGAGAASASTTSDSEGDVVYTTMTSYGCLDQAMFEVDASFDNKSGQTFQKVSYRLNNVEVVPPEQLKDGAVRTFDLILENIGVPADAGDYTLTVQTGHTLLGSYTFDNTCTGQQDRGVMHIYINRPAKGLVDCVDGALTKLTTTAVNDTAYVKSGLTAILNGVPVDLTSTELNPTQRTIQTVNPVAMGMGTASLFTFDVKSNGVDQGVNYLVNPCPKDQASLPDHTYTMAAGQPHRLNVLQGGSPGLRLVSVSAAECGTAQRRVGAGGWVWYLPNSDCVGQTEVLTVKARNGAGQSVTATETVHLTAQSDPPVINLVVLDAASTEQCPVMKKYIWSVHKITTLTAFGYAGVGGHWAGDKRPNRGAQFVCFPGSGDYVAGLAGVGSSGQKLYDRFNIHIPEAPKAPVKVVKVVQHPVAPPKKIVTHVPVVHQPVSKPVKPIHHTKPPKLGTSKHSHERTHDGHHGDGNGGGGKHQHDAPGGSTPNTGPTLGS